MAKIAIYDKFYQSAAYPDSDIASQALAGSEHEVVGAATDIRQAARQLLDFADVNAAERPDIIIMGGMLEGETEYRTHPFTVTEPCVVRRRNWLGNIKEEAGTRITFLLPQFEQDGITYHFPSVVPVGNAPKGPPAELLGQWRHGLTGIGAVVLSRIAKTYFPEADRLGVSSSPMFDAMLTAEEVNRSNLDAGQHLRERLQALTGEA